MISTLTFQKYFPIYYSCKKKEKSDYLGALMVFLSFFNRYILQFLKIKISFVFEFKRSMKNSKSLMQGLYGYDI